MHPYSRAAPEDPADPLALLMACHERIERHLDGLAELVKVEDPHDPRVPPTIDALVHYFSEGLPLHGADEDLSLAPRLLALGADAELEAALSRIHDEHVRMDEALPDLLYLLSLLREGDGDVLPHLGSHHAWLDLLLRGHMATEEANIFPRIAALPEAERRAIVLEIRARRA